MQYANIRKAVFIDRPNRFIANVKLEGRVVQVHVKNTGRCRELLIPGADVYIQGSDNLNRKTAYSLISVQKGDRLINMDSQAPNHVWAEFLDTKPVLPGFGRVEHYKREVAYGASRMDFYVESGYGNGYIEVKGCTLEADGVARFPDAPTERGTRHIYELTKAVQCGIYATAVFVIQMENICYFEPNRCMDPAFADALQQAQKVGVHLLAYTCHVTPEILEIATEIPVSI